MPLTVNLDKSTIDSNAGKNGLLKEVNGVNGSPVSLAPGFPDLEDQFNQMGITYIRLHDNLGIADLDNYYDFSTRGDTQNQIIVNIPDNLKQKSREFLSKFGNIRTIFPNAAAGMRANNVDLAFKNANYGMTDSYLRKITSNNPSINPGNLKRDIMFRIGRSNGAGYELPGNFDIYATLVSTLVERYSLNYIQTGLAKKITYWEVWNEPDLPFFWNSNKPEKYYEFYEKIARMVKSVDPNTKIGGSAIANGFDASGPYIEGFLSYCKKNNVPIDFISWHCYGNVSSDPQSVITNAGKISTLLDKYGFSHIESINSEWNSSPFGTKNTYSKVQSAKNAAFIASSLSYMQYCKVDKSYFYRGDALPFGIFNDNPNPANKNFKTFCTYAGQAFNLFSRIFETPYILQQDKSFNTGLTILPCIDSSGRKLNILASNYKVDKSFTDGNKAPSESSIYQQYYLDCNRDINQLTDEWSINEWFGGINPTTITGDNVVNQNNTVSQIPNSGQPQPVARDYSNSDTGIIINIKNLVYTDAKVTVFRIRENGDLSSLQPPMVNNEVTSSVKDGILTINDPYAVNSTVTLYSIELNNKNPVTPIPNPPTNGKKYTKVMTRSDNTLIDFLPDDFKFIANKKYQLNIQGIPASAGIKTSGKFERAQALWNYYVVESPNKSSTYQYDFGNTNILSIFSSSSPVGNFTVAQGGGYTVTCTLTEL